MLTPYPYQQEIIDRFKDQEACALLMEAGSGKTLISINILRHKYNQGGRVIPTVIFCPIIVLNNWKREILQCSKVPEESVGVVMGTKKKRLETIRNPKHKILIINYEATRSDEILNALKEFNPLAVICDESHKIKNQRVKTRGGKSTLTGAVFNISKGAIHRQILSGTPIPNPEDIWSQFYFLDRGQTFGKKYYSFKNKYFINRNQDWDSQKAFPDWRFIPSMAPEYRERLASKSVSMKKEECVDLPDLVEKSVDITPSPEMLKHYMRIKNQLITWLDEQDDNPMVVQNALTKTLRLAEILSGYLKLEDETVEPLKTNPTLDGLMEILESTAPAKVIVFAQFKQNYADIRKRLEKAKIEYVEIHGEISTKQKLENVDVFNDMNNKVRVCIANAASGGVGINLKSASYTVYYSMGYSLVDFEQSRARNYRSGSIDLHPKITHYYLRHKELITDKILYAVRNKQKFANNLLDLKKVL